MKYLKKFNEEFDFSKLNPFSKKGPLKDEELANNIYQKCKNQPEFKTGYQGPSYCSSNYYLSGLLATEKYYYCYVLDGDNIVVDTHNDYLAINNRELECSKEIKEKLYSLFKERVDIKAKEFMTNLQNKYSNAQVKN